MSYNPENITDYAGDYISCIRFLIQDKNSKTFSDEEITALYNVTEGTDEERVYRTALQCAYSLQSNITSWSSAGTSVTYNQDYLSSLISRLQAQITALYGAGMFTVLYPHRCRSYDTWI